jgi:ATP-binding cassette subfamily B protein RaxB
MSNRLEFSFRKLKKLPMILQGEIADCGHACVAMISNYHGHHIDLSFLKNKMHSSVRGTSLSSLISLFSGLGFETRALSVPLKEMQYIKTPAVIHWNLNHFVVLEKVKPKGIVIHDPATGRRTCSWDLVSQSFTGIVLEVSKKPCFHPIQAHSPGIRKMLAPLREIWNFLLYLLLISIFLEVFTLINPLFLQYITDLVVGYHEKNNLYAIAIAFSLLAALHTFTSYIRGNMVLFLSKNITDQFSSYLISHILKLPLSYFEKQSTGDIYTRFQSVHEIQRKLSSGVVTALLDGGMIGITLIVMTYYSAYLTMIVSAFLLGNFVIRYSSFNLIRQKSEVLFKKHSQALSVFLETLQAILPIKAYSKEKRQFNNWHNQFTQSLNAEIKIEKLQILYQAVENFFTAMEYIIVLCIAATLVLKNEFTIGMLMAFLSYRLLFVGKAQSLLRNISEFKQIQIQTQRVCELIRQKPEEISLGKGIELPKQASLRVENISFQYTPDESWVFKNINLLIEPGEKVAIVGSSGCGKTTLMKVLMGLFEPQEGKIYLDSINLNDFGLINYRKIIASVMQEDTLLQGSILENIIFFEEHFTYERVYEVAQIAQIHTFIMALPMGYESRVGNLGSSLSGGQKQRILLARALYKNPQFLFLDEATSHLDAKNEFEINKALQRLNITQIIIAHRQETINMADRIIDLQLL